MSEKQQKQQTTRHTAGAFDVRTIIAGLIGVYGLILTGLGTFRATEEELARADGLNINLWAGLGMLAVAAAFGLWVRLRPIVVEEPTSDGPAGSGGPDDRGDRGDS